jgi:hypothetical protein
MSNDTDTRIVDLQVNNASLITPSGTIGTSFATATTINFNKTPTKDSHSGYSSGVYTVAVPGDYFVSARLEMSHTASTGSFVGASIAVNGVERAAQAIKPLSPNAYPFVSSLITGLVAGDQITIRLFGDSAAKAFVASIVNDFTVHRLSGPSAIAASETVAARYTNTAGTTITNSLTAVPFATRAYDSHGSFSTPTYTVPVSGKYRVSGVLTTQSVTLATTNDFQVQIFKTGAMVANAFTLGNGAANGQSVQVHTTIDCLAGDTLDVRARISSSVALSTTANNNVICIERIGN